MPQKCKSSTERQRFITTIKKCDIKKHKSLIRFHNANKIDNYNKAGEKKEKNPKESTEQVKT